jgi:hypothetical protein
MVLATKEYQMHLLPKSLLVLSAILCTQLASATSAAKLDEATASPADPPLTRDVLPVGPLSFGEPETLGSLIYREEGPFGNLETPVDDLASEENIDMWTDAQIETHYRAAWELTNEILDQPATSGAAKRMGYYTAASLGNTGRSGISAMTCMGVAIQGEAGGEPQSGKVAVGETIMARAKGIPSRICAVVFAGGQFESMLHRMRKVSADSLRAAHSTISERPKTCGFDYFLNKGLQLRLKRSIPEWVHNFEREGCASKIEGQQTFYSSCNCRRGGASYGRRRRA